MKKVITALAFVLSVAPFVFAQVGINTTGNPPHSSSVLDVESTSQGMLPPRMTTSERNGIASPLAEGLTIYNTTTKCLEVWEGSGWLNLCLGCSSAPLAPSAATHVTSSSSVTWKWNAVTGASGYKYNTSNDYSGAIDTGTNIQYAQTGLTCASNYTFYVWSYNGCGVSSVTTLNASTSVCPFVCGSSSVSHGYVAGVTPGPGLQYTNRSYTTLLAAWGGVGGNQCWTKMNLGSTQSPSSATDNSDASAGWYFQFNRSQGFHHDGVTRTPNTSWIASVNENSNWLAVNDPCTQLLGSGWRVPTQPEWANFRTAAGGMNSGFAPAAFSSPLQLHMGGLLDMNTGALTSRGSGGWYWTSTQLNNTNGRNLDFYSGSSASTNGSKTWTFTMRCIKD